MGRALKKAQADGAIAPDAAGDLFAEYAGIASPLAIANLSSAVATLAQLHAEAAALAETMKAKQKEINEFEAKRLPDLFTAVNMKEFMVADGPFQGVKVEVKDFVSGSLAKDSDEAPDARSKAIAALIKAGGGDLIKSSIAMVFDKSQHNMAGELFEALRKQAKRFDLAEPVMGEDVHAQSLQAFAREKLKNGETIEAEALETIGLYVGRVAKLKWPKNRK